MVEIVLTYATVDDLARDHQDNLRKGRAFVVGAEPRAERERCRLVLVHPVSSARLPIEVEVVWVKSDEPGKGVGVQIVDFGDEKRALLASFVTSPPEPARAAEPEPPPEPQPELEPDDTGPAPPRNIHDRVRGLGIADRVNLARTGSLPERVALERCFGGLVWEGLLTNPQITPPEVARIAKNGTIPKPLVQTLVSNAAWLAVPEIQRALLTNPRVSGPHLERVLRAVPRAELARIASLSTYRTEVRSLAAKAIKPKG